MVLGKGDYVYVPQLEKYGIIVGIYGREETLYTVTFPWDFVEDADFEESQLVKLDSLYFPKGSLVKGLKGAKRYKFTTDKATMEVMGNKNDGRMLVKILKHKNKSYVLYTEHWVDSMWFEFIKFPSNFIR